MEFKILEKMFERENPSSVFEMGSAVGGLLLDIERKYPNIKVGGIDNHKSDHSNVKEIFKDSKDNFILGDAWNIPWAIPDNSYDIVFTVGFFTVIKSKPAKVIKEMMRIAKDKIILAENHGPYDGSNIAAERVRVTRDYKQILNSLKIRYEIVEGDEGKTIFKCKKQ